MTRAWKKRVAAAFARSEDNDSFPPARPFTDLSQHKSIEHHRKLGAMLGLDNPFFRSTEGQRGRQTIIDGKPCLNYSWCDYLGLSQHPEMIAAAKTAIDTYGTCISASRMVAGDLPLHRQLEAEICKTIGTEDALAFVSGHAANVSTIGTLMTSADLIVHDEFVHNSAVVGMRLSGATMVQFKHNRLDLLEDTLRRERGKYRNAMIVIEGLYSTEGSVPDLPRIIELKKRFGCWLMVDDAHGAGVLGRHGRGCAEHFGIDGGEVDIWMGTLSKTYASCGGYIAGNRQMIDVLRHFAPGFVFSVGLPPSMAASALTALRIIAREPERVARLHANGALFRDEARALGLDTGRSIGIGIIPIMVGASTRAAKIVNRLFERGISSSLIIYPGVPINSARLRFFVTSEHTPDEIRNTVRAVKEEMGGT